MNSKVIDNIEGLQEPKGKQPCQECGDSGVSPITGELCVCRIDSNRDKYEFKETNNQYIPKAYYGVRFKRGLVSSTMPEKYGIFLDKLLEEITSGKLSNQNIVICSPTGTSKSVFAYTAMDYLSLKEVKTAPILDIMEIKSLLMDLYKKDITKYGINIDDILSVSYLFIHIPLDVPSHVFGTMETIISRRVRYGGSTIFLYGGDFRNLANMDKSNQLIGLMGDGSFKSFRVEQFYRIV